MSYLTLTLEDHYNIFTPLAKAQGLDVTEHPTIKGYFKDVYTCGAYQLYFKAYSMGVEDGIRINNKEIQE